MNVDGLLMPSYSTDLFDQVQTRPEPSVVSQPLVKEEQCESFDEAQ
jgi:hypothetical protein